MTLSQMNCDWKNIGIRLLTNEFEEEQQGPNQTSVWWLGTSCIHIHMVRASDGRMDILLQDLMKSQSRKIQG